MTVELVHNEPVIENERRVFRIRADALALKRSMTRAQVKAVYAVLERARDDLSAVLDRYNEENP